MNTVVREAPAVYIADRDTVKDQAVQEFGSFCFRFSVDMRPHEEANPSEMTNGELLEAADSAGTFKFLDGDEEDIYEP